VRIRFLTSTPLDISRGSGTYVGMYVLARALEGLGHQVDFETPRVTLPVYTAQRLLFNWELRPSQRHDLTVGFDMDGYRIAGTGKHVASLKGVIADEVRFESGMTRVTMGIQARCEKLHVQRAAKVIVTSRYSAERASQFYGLQQMPEVVPELIELDQWKRQLTEAEPERSGRFRVLYVGRLYRRKRVDILLRAAAILRSRIPGVEVRIVGNGPEAPRLRQMDAGVSWLGDVSRAQLVREYKSCDLFCLPSVQEGFGIVLLEAMASGKPIVASRAAAIPEVVPHAALVQPDEPELLAKAIEGVYLSPVERREEMGRAGAQRVEQFDAPRVAQKFLDTVAGLSGC
jgi:glycosyltransferase involved in cell wall biosynthesis